MSSISDQAHADLNILLADRAAGRSVSEAQISAATRLVRIIDRDQANERQNQLIRVAERAADEQKLNQFRSANASLQRERDAEAAEQQRQSDAVAERRKEKDKVFWDKWFDDRKKLVAELASSVNRSEKLLNVYFSKFFAEYYPALLDLLPCIYSSAEDDAEATAPTPIIGLKLVASELDTLLLSILIFNVKPKDDAKTRNTNNLEYPILWKSISARVGGIGIKMDPMTKAIRSIRDASKLVRGDLKTSQISLEGIQNIQRQCETELADSLRSFNIGVKPELHPESKVLVILSDYDKLHKTEHLNRYKNILFLFAKACCGWNGTVSPQEERFLKSYKDYLDATV